MEVKRTVAILTVEDWTAVDCASTATTTADTTTFQGQPSRCGILSLEVVEVAVQATLDPAGLEISCSTTPLLKDQTMS